LSFGNKYSSLVNRWFKCEYFYSWIDRPYFQATDFNKLLEALELKNVKLNQIEWSVVRQTLLGEGKSKPRRFSAAMI